MLRPVHRLGLRDRALWIGRPAGEPVSLVHRGRQRARKFGSEFVGDIEGEVPASVEEELNLRTPGYLSWHCERWQICCGDACAYLGPVGWDRLKDMPDAQAAILDDGWPEDVLPDITENGAVIGGYLFRCLHCGAHRAHADA